MGSNFVEKNLKSTPIQIERFSMSKVKKAGIKLPFPVPTQSQTGEEDSVHNAVRPKPEGYADRTWAPPRGTRRSFGKR